MAEKVNLRPDEYVEGGGLIDDFDGTITDIRFIMTDYNGGIQDAIPAARVTFEVDGEEAEAILYSVGGKDDFAPDESGMGLIKLKSKSSLTKTAKFPMLMASIVDAGFPLNKMEEESIGYLVGFEGHFLRKAVEYKGLKKKEGERENTVLLCTKILKLPWEGKAVKVKGKTTAKRGGSKAKAAADPELTATVVGIIQSILIMNDGTLVKKNLLSALFKDDDMKALGDGQRAALTIAKDDTFLGGQEEWTYELGILKMV